MIEKDNAAKKIAVVLFNLGGPKNEKDVFGFLYNLFSDPLIIRLPAFLRKPIAWLAARRRRSAAQKNYALLGGGSPLLQNTKAQAEALESQLAQDNAGEKNFFKTFIAMRYFYPFVEDAVKEIEAFMPEEIILLPLYPQYSTTTTESSLRSWRRAYKKSRLTANFKAVCCWADHPDFIAAHADLLCSQIKQNKSKKKLGKFHVLFSAHGIPERIIREGDPYQNQVELTARHIAQAAHLDVAQWSLAYQSRVGPLKWIGPETGSEIRRLSQNVETIFVVPISFVSEHVETLVELDIEFGEIARSSGLKNYVRVPALGTHEKFIFCLETLACTSLNAQNTEKLLCPENIPGSPCTDVFSDD